MDNFILRFAEIKNNNPKIALPEIEYCPQKSLNIIKGTNKPAISSSNQAMDTHTVTKVRSETTDSDFVNPMAIDTMTVTNVNMEGIDSDAGHSMLMDTMTRTDLNIEGSDSDFPNLPNNHLDTFTFTEDNREATDSDR